MKKIICLLVVVLLCGSLVSNICVPAMGIDALEPSVMGEGSDKDEAKVWEGEPANAANTKRINSFDSMPISQKTAAEEAVIVDSGECGLYGDNLVWQLDSNGVLTITGMGDMADYTWTNFVPTTPWYAYKNSIKKIVVEDGVTSVGKSAFYRLSSATTVQISNDVLVFGAYAFAMCSKIQSIDFPDNLQYIANYCFEDCYTLSSATIPESVIKLGDCVFTGCSKLKSIDLPSNMKVLPRGFFSECASLESVEIPDGVTEFVSFCFRDCTSLKNILLPTELTTIGYRVFYGCTGLEEMVLPDSVTTLDGEVFYNCTGLTKLELPRNLKTLPQSLCYNCTKLQEVEIPQAVSAIEDTAFYNCVNLSRVILNEGLKKIGKNVFYKCVKLTNIVFPESVTSIGQNAYGFYMNVLDEKDIIPGAKVYCYQGTAGEAYAKTSGLPYSIIDGSDWIALNGNVFSYGDNTADVILELVSADGKSIYTMTIVGNSANYSFKVARLGTYTLTVSKENHVERSYTVTLGTESTEQDVTICLIGDVTGDGKVNVGDVSKLYAHIRSTAQLTNEYQLLCANVNGGNVNVGDVSAIYAHIKGTKKLY